MFEEIVDCGRELLLIPVGAGVIVELCINVVVELIVGLGSELLLALVG